MAAVLSESMCTPPLVMIRLRYVTLVQWNSHFFLLSADLPFIVLSARCSYTINIERGCPSRLGCHLDRLLQICTETRTVQYWWSFERKQGHLLGRRTLPVIRTVPLLIGRKSPTPHRVRFKVCYKCSESPVLCRNELCLTALTCPKSKAQGTGSWWCLRSVVRSRHRVVDF